MAATRITFDTVREIGLGLPGVVESTMYGSPALKVGKELLAGLPVNKSAEPGSLAVRIDFEQRAAMLEEAPDTYYLTPHYESYPVVLVRMSRINRAALKDLLGAGWKFVTSKKPSRKAKRYDLGA